MPTQFMSRTPIDELQRRQTFDLRPWHDAGVLGVPRSRGPRLRAHLTRQPPEGGTPSVTPHVRQTLEQLHASVRERLDRAERSRNSPNNLIKHNPAFVGRVRELTELRKALAKNKLGVVGAREGLIPALQRIPRVREELCSRWRSIKWPKLQKAQRR